VTEWRVPVGAETTAAIFEPTATPSRGTLFVFAHGAGGHMSDRGMLAMSEELCSRGIDIVRFNFLYREKKLGRPDPMPLLQQCLDAVVAYARTTLRPQRLIIGGRSMGGRAASMMAAEGYACDGLLLLAYPLHPAGKPEQLRDAHLARIKVPTLCLNGTRDALCTRELMERVVSKLERNWTMHWLEGADHSFHVLKSSGRTDNDVLAEAGEAFTAWGQGYTF
jgi:predicted alpha/beta-hydrolase family hydrolase